MLRERLGAVRAEPAQTARQLVPSGPHDGRLRRVTIQHQIGQQCLDRVSISMASPDADGVERVAHTD